MATFSRKFEQPFLFSKFNLVTLNENDLHVIESTETYLFITFLYTTIYYYLNKLIRYQLFFSLLSSLRSADVETALSAVDFLSNVVLQDFAAEVFLQKPDIVKVYPTIICIQFTDCFVVEYMYSTYN